MIKTISFIFLIITLVKSSIIEFGGIPNDSSLEIAWKNGALLNGTLNSLQSGDELIFPNTTFYLVGGIKAGYFKNVVIHFEGTLIFTDNYKTWPADKDGNVLECIELLFISNVTFTSSSVGILDGSGEAWWGLIGYARFHENRPRLLSIGNSTDILIENLFFKNSPYWTVWIWGVDGLEIRFSEISNRRDQYDGHNFYNLEAFNTDGFDVTGRNVYIHDCSIWNQDDCIAVKDWSENMLFERINASGLGLTIGSIGGSVVRNITFRDSYMHKTYKGIYAKFRDNGLISQVLYENIVIYEPEQWPIWIGPAQQADNVDICLPNPCSLCWPEIPFAQCNMPKNATYIDITLRNVTVINPVKRTGIIIGSTTNPIQNILFDNVIFQNPKEEFYYACENVQNGKSIGNTYPIPNCFNKGK
eukprot:gene7797-9597_t